MLLFTKYIWPTLTNILCTLFNNCLRIILDPSLEGNVNILKLTLWFLVTGTFAPLLIRMRPFAYHYISHMSPFAVNGALKGNTNDRKKHLFFLMEIPQGLSPFGVRIQTPRMLHTKSGQDWHGSSWVEDVNGRRMADANPWQMSPEWLRWLTQCLISNKCLMRVLCILVCSLMRGQDVRSFTTNHLPCRVCDHMKGHEFKSWDQEF